MTSIDGKTIANTLYHAALISALSIGYAKLGHMAIKGSLPKLDLTVCDAGLLFIDVSSAILTRNYLIKQKIIPANIAE